MILPHGANNNDSVLVLLLLAAWADARVSYSPVTCAVRGSTVTLPCSFTPIMPVVRVRWCVSHPICQGSTPSVYDSRTIRNNWRYLYLGDMERNCTLQIHNVQTQDNTTFRFRMEARDNAGHFTGTTGVAVTVVDGDPMSVQSSAPGSVSEGAAVTLNCASRCSFHQVGVRWHQDGHALPESGPTLRLTAGQSANYTCGLVDRASTTSPPFRLNVQPPRADGNFVVPLVVSLGLLMALLLVIAVVVVVVKRKRRPASRHEGKRGEKENQRSEQVPGGERGGPDGQEIGQDADEINYATVQFQSRATNRRPAETSEDVVYSSVARPST
ncbi:uncharacterized protein LOC144022514 isoform X2 [Festucalex cinctus]